MHQLLLPVILSSMKISVAVLLTILAVAVPVASDNSSTSFASGWTEEQEPQVFPKGQLYDYIDGGAELYEEFGAIRLTVRQFRKSNDELELLTCEMASPAAALGIYLMQIGTERSITGIKARNSGSTSQVTAVRGKTYIQITSLNSSAEMQTPMVNLANWALASGSDGKPISLFGMLPRDSLIPGSERIVHGPLGLNQMMRIFDGNPLGLGESTWGVGAKYRRGEKSAAIRLIVEYSDERAALTALSNMKKEADTSWSTVSSSVNAVEFVNRQQERLTARVENKQLVLLYRSEATGGK